MITVLEYALLSGHVYNPNIEFYLDRTINKASFKKLKHLPDGWTIVSHLPGEIPSGLNYFAALYVKFDRGRVTDAVVAIRGTVANIPDNDVVDAVSWFSDVFGEGRSDRLPAYLGPIWRFVHMCFSEITQHYPHVRLTLTGHSLGGALAQLIPMKYYIFPAVVFNSPGCGHIPDIMLWNQTSVYNINSTYGFINKIGATVGKTFYVNVPEEAAEAKAMMKQFSAEENAIANAIDVMGDKVGGLASYGSTVVAGELKLDNYYQASEALNKFIPDNQHSAAEETYNPIVALNDAFFGYLHDKARLALLSKTIIEQHSIINMIKALSAEQYAGLSHTIIW